MKEARLQSSFCGSLPVTFELHVDLIPSLRPGILPTRRIHFSCPWGRVILKKWSLGKCVLINSSFFGINLFKVLVLICVDFLALHDLIAPWILLLSWIEVGLVCFEKKNTHIIWYNYILYKLTNKPLIIGACVFSQNWPAAWDKTLLNQDSQTTLGFHACPSRWPIGRPPKWCEYSSSSLWLRGIVQIFPKMFQAPPWKENLNREWNGINESEQRGSVKVAFDEKVSQLLLWAAFVLLNHPFWRIQILSGYVFGAHAAKLSLRRFSQLLLQHIYGKVNHPI